MPGAVPAGPRAAHGLRLVPGLRARGGGCCWYLHSLISPLTKPGSVLGISVWGSKSWTRKTERLWLM